MSQEKDKNSDYIDYDIERVINDLKLETVINSVKIDEKKNEK